MEDQGQAEALFSQGNERLQARDYPGAEACFRRAIEASPDLAEAFVNLGLALERQGCLAEAESAYFRALTLEPECLEAYVDLGALLVGQKRFQEAEELYGCGIQCFPDSPALWSNLGALHTGLERDAEGERCFRRALGLDATYHKARYNLSYLLLRQGRFEEGWEALESRVRNVELMAHIPDSRWRGRAWWANRS